MDEAQEGKKYRYILEDKMIAVCFYQPSTRTYLSFMAAGQKLGAQTLGYPGMVEFSSVNKGESLEDTIKTIEALQCDAIVLRHPEDDSALIAANAVETPIISGGAGKLEHPTQALLDLFTVVQETGQSPSNLHIAFVGDLKNGRTVHSLAKLMAIMGNQQMSFVSPEVVKMPTNLISWLNGRGVETYQTTDLLETLSCVDVIYDTRVQKEWFTTEEDYLKAKLGQQITPQVMSLAKPNAVLMHPLPRVDEITSDVDSDPRAAYFRQVTNGLYTRMALLSLILS